MTPTLTIALPQMDIPQAAAWVALPADQQPAVARTAAATCDTIANVARQLGRQYRAASEAIAEIDVTGEISPEAAEALIGWERLSQDESERLRMMRMLGDMAKGMRDQAKAMEREADMWRSRAGDLFAGEAGAL